MKQTQKAPDRQTAAILAAFGLVVALWMVTGPVEALSIIGAMLLPPLLGYEVGGQCAGKAPQGRE